MTCEACPYGGIKVGTRGPLDAPIVIVGDHPHPIDLAKRTPFNGPNNELLQKMLKEAGILDLGLEIMYINATECFARDKKTGVQKKVINNVTHKMPGGKQKWASALKMCRGRLIETIAKHPRKMIIALGAGAIQSITGDFTLKINNVRGTIFQTDLAEYGVISIQHPTQLLKGGGSLMQYRGDFLRAFNAFKNISYEKFVQPEYEILTNKGQVLSFAEKLNAFEKSLIGADIETGGFDFWKNEILELGLTTDGKNITIIPGDLLIPELFHNKEHEWVWHNGKFDIKFFWQLGMDARVDHDTMLMSYALDETSGKHGLEQVGWDWLGSPDYKDMLKPYLPNKKTSYREIPEHIRRKYAAIDVAVTFQLFEPMFEELMKHPKQFMNYTKVLIPASEYLARVEFNGFLVDRQWAIAHRDQMLKEMRYYESKFQAIAIEEVGHVVNMNSPQQLKAYLYGHLKLAHPEQKTSRKILEALPYHAALEPLLKVRKLKKYLSTYVFPCLNKVDEHGRIHATYKLIGTVTGRLASSGPNMQNIPRLKAVRGMFKAPKGRILIECDLSQAELRSLAQLSGDPELCRIFNSDELSLHDEVTAEVFPAYTDPTVSEVEKKEMKMRGKAINFGIVYGRQAFSFVAEFGISLMEAQHWIEKWLARFPKARDFIRNCRGAVINGNVLQTVFGRKRRFGVITPERRRKMENEASNFPHQSTASDITLIAGTILEPTLRKKYGAKVVNTVHDCIVIECDPKDVNEIVPMVIAIMQKVPVDWGLTRVPFLAEGEVGERWGHMEEWHKWAKKLEAYEQSLKQHQSEDANAKDHETT